MVYNHVGPFLLLPYVAAPQINTSVQKPCFD